MVGWHHQHNGHEFEKTPGDSEGQGSLVHCIPWGHKESDMTLGLNKSNSGMFHLEFDFWKVCQKCQKNFKILGQLGS